MSAPRQYRFIADGHVYIVRADGTGTPIFAIEHLGSERVTSRALASSRVLITGSDGRPLLLIAACEDVEEEP